MSNVFLSKSIVISTILSLLSAGATHATSDISISDDELLKFKYLLEVSGMPLTAAIEENLKQGRIRIDQGGNVILDKSIFELLKNRIESTVSTDATICVKTGSGN